MCKIKEKRKEIKTKMNGRRKWIVQFEWAISVVLTLMYNENEANIQHIRYGKHDEKKKRIKLTKSLNSIFIFFF